MAKVIRGAYLANETAFILRQLLGPDREWWNYLNDVRQNRVSEGIPLLTPVGYVRAGKGKQPIYRAGDISKFVTAWRGHFPKSTRRPKPVPIYYVDDSDDRAHWRFKKLTVAS